MAVKGCLIVLNIAFVNSEKSPVRLCKELSLSDLSTMLSKPVISPVKEGKGWMPADIEPGARTGARVQSVSALVLDIEADTSKDPTTGVKTAIGTEPPNFANMCFELAGDYQFIAHTSYHHHDPAILPADVLHPRYRIVFALSRPLVQIDAKTHEVKLLAHHVAGLLGLSDCVDTSCMEPARLYYLPRCPADRLDQFQHEAFDGAPLDVDALLGEICRDEAALTQAKQRDTNNPSVIDAFNASYAPGDILEGNNGYIPKRGNRWMHPSSTTGMPGVRLLPNSTPERIFSSHSNDPLNDGHAHDAFDCYRILEHGGDIKSAVREAARLLGIGNRQQEAPQREYSSLLSVSNARVSQQTNEEPEEPPFKRVSLADVLTNPPEPQRYVWGERVPFDVLSLLAAHGGTGKSLMAMQLAAHTATGRPFLALPTEKIKTLFFSAEDSTDAIRRRFGAICQADGLDPEELARNLIVLDATAAPCLFHEVSNDGVRTGEPTAHYYELKALIEAEGVGFLIVDNASDSFGANPIDRQAVTKFIRALVRLVRGKGGAVLLLSHVNKVTSRNGAKQADSEGYADSAAWHNASRSRLFLNSNEKGGLTLSHNKSNYGKKQPTLNLAFREDGSSLHAVDAVQASEFDGADPAAGLLRNLNRLPVLKLIREYYKREEWISPSKQSNTGNAFAMLRDDAAYPPLLDKRDCLAMLRECEIAGLMIKETYQKENRHEGKRWQLTPEGLEFIGEPLPPAPSKQAELLADKVESEEVACV
jgi:AAA domain